MKAMIFAAGMGTRLRPFTLEHPKALVSVQGVPMLERVMRRVIDAGATEVVVNVHHFADQIIGFLAEKDNFGLGGRLTVSDESDLLLDTGGGIAKAAQILAPKGSDEPVLVHNADILTDFPIHKMLSAPHGDAQLLVADRQTSRYLLFKDNRMCGWTNRKTGQYRPIGLCGHQPSDCQAFAFGGVHLLSADTVRDIAEYATERFGNAPTPFSVIDYYVDRCALRDFRSFIPSGPYQWYDIGSPEKLEEAQRFIS